MIEGCNQQTYRVCGKPIIAPVKKYKKHFREIKHVEVPIADDVDVQVEELLL